ncbi:hypothetical protein F5Y14DRAFT_396062 [Nemania sp. NC0429]|nr:hypothetical protein F5Y14DRAFT_396062 [Nemania sp. NC0429]
MRRHVAISRLLACLIGLSVADDGPQGPPQGGEQATTASAQIVRFINRPTDVIRWEGTTIVTYEADGNVEISTIRLKLYNKDGRQDDRIIPNASLLLPTAPINAGSVSPPGGTAPDNDLLSSGPGDNTLTITWSRNPFDLVPSSFHQFLDWPLYLESEWKNTSISGSSTSPLFAVYESDASKARQNLAAVASDSSSPARLESITTAGLSPPSSSPTGTPNPSSQATTATNQPAATIGPEPEPEPASQAPSGLSKGAIIGIAVGVGGGVLLGAAVLLWFFCVRRRRGGRNAAHHTMPSYDSDVGAHASMTDKETPVLLETTSRQSAYGAERRSSVDPYPPYSDRSVASPTPHYRGTTSIDAPAATTTSQTDLTWAEGAPAPAPVIASRYAHLVEDGMTEEEIRRLEDEERQLDAAIENAGRRRDT